MFNAGLLRTIAFGYPQAQVAFLAEPDHLHEVRKCLADLGAELPGRFQWREIDIPPAERGVYWGRFTRTTYKPARLWCEAFRRRLNETPPDLLVFASMSPVVLCAWKRAASGGTESPTLVVVHSFLALLEHRSSVWRVALLFRRSPPGPGSSPRPRRLSVLAAIESRLVSVRRILKMGSSRRLRYVALGASILRHLQELDPKLARRFSALDPPCLWIDGKAAPAADAPPSVVTFGFFGVGFKGFDVFARAASALKPGFPRARFLLVGFLNTPQEGAFKGVVEGVGEKPLSLDEYRRRASEVTYSVWTAWPEHYRLVASVSFVDAIAFGKPGIYLRNPFVEHYFETIGDIGYLCDSIDEVVATARSVLESFPRERYERQCRAIREGRRLFSPEALGERFRAIAAECGAEG